MKQIVFVSFVLLAVFPLTLISQVRVEEIDMDIPTYLMGPEDPHPALWNRRVYPYPYQTDITRSKTIKSYRVVRLENEYIEILILPELGGKILAAFDKTNENFDFIYHNRVVKPGLVALRGAWLSGGIEWNFPSYGHTVNTFSPVNHKIIHNDDGSVTCVVGTEEWVRRMKWLVFITVSPGRSAFKTRIRLDNRTLCHNNAYFWANAAAHAWEDTRIIFPPTSYTYSGGRRNPSPWPIYRAQDVSWYKNTPSAHDYFCGTPGDFNGTYNYERDNGTAHYASGFESPGKKFWTWGTARSGKIWEDILTDSDGQYVEVQAGRLPTQRGDTWIFEPRLIEEWEEWWYPLKHMKGFVKANPDAALNLIKTENGVFLSLNTTRQFEGARLELFGDNVPLWEKKIDLSPQDFFLEEISLGQEYEIFDLKFFESTGAPVIEYSSQPQSVPQPELQPEFSQAPGDSAEIAFLKGYYAMKHWEEEEASDYFKDALRLDPGFTEAKLWLGIFHFRSGETGKALDYFNGCLERNEDNLAARYYRALCKIRLGIQERTKDDLYMVGRRAAFRHVAPYVLASMEIREGEFERAGKLLENCLKVNPGDVQARVMRAAVLRHEGKVASAVQELNQALKIDPLSPLALIERFFLSGERELEILNEDVQYYLEAATDYINMGMRDEAIKILNKYMELCPGTKYPLVCYYLGYLHHLGNEKAGAEEYFRKGASWSPDYVFPFRFETEKVLKLALRYNPRDWKACYYLGNLLTSKLRWEEGLSFYQDAAKLDPAFSVLYRNLGEIYWKKIKDLEKAETMYEKALSYAPQDYRLHVALDEIYALRGKQAARDQLYQEATQSVRKNFNTLLSRAKYFVDNSMYGEALSILRNNQFLPWEGWTGARQVFVQALLARAGDYMQEGRFKEAITDLEEAMTYPENLGTGRPAFPVFAREYYLIGLCYENLGESVKCLEFFTKAAGEDPGSSAEQAKYVSLASQKLKKKGG